MERIRERLISGFALLFLGIVTTGIVLLLGVEDLFTAMIIATPAMVPAFTYRGFTGIERFQYEQYKNDKSIVRRGLETVTVVSIAGLPSVPVGLSVYWFSPWLTRTPRFFVAFLTATIIVFVVSAPISFKLNDEYFEGGW